MNELSTTLREHADALSVHPDVDDVFRRVDRRRRRQRMGGTVASFAVVAAAAVGVVAIRRDAQQATTPAAGIVEPTDPTAPTGSPAASGPAPVPTFVVANANWFGALVVTDGPPGTPLDRYDATAADGPWTWTFRLPGGSLAFDSVVVTYPVDEPTTLIRNVTIGGGESANHGYAGANYVVWPIGGGWVRMRGDVEIEQLVQWAGQIDLVDGSIRWTTSDDVPLRAGWSAPYRATHVHEMRYGSAELGVAGALGDGLLYTGVLEAGGFEDALFAGNATGGYTVDGHPAVVSGVQGGNATLAWQVAPGLVGYVGYSGLSRSDAAIAALVEIANRTDLIDAGAWAAREPQVAESHNDFGMGVG